MIILCTLQNTNKLSIMSCSGDADNQASATKEEHEEKVESIEEVSNTMPSGK